MRLLITGGAGFIGSNLVRLALAEGVDVTVLDDLSTGYREYLDGLDVRFSEASVLDAAAVADALVNVDSVIHLARSGAFRAASRTRSGRTPRTRPAPSYCSRRCAGPG